MSTSEFLDAEILAFARKWLPFGGGTSGDILVEFGMTPGHYLSRLDASLRGPAAENLEPEEHQALNRFVAVRMSRCVRSPARIS